MGKTQIRKEQLLLTDFLKNLATNSAEWSSTSITPSAAAILAKIQEAVARAFQNRGAWTVAATDAAGDGIRNGYIYTYASDTNGSIGSGNAQQTLEKGDILIACTDNADITDPGDWVILNFNLTGAVTESTLVSALQNWMVAGSNISFTVPAAGQTNAGKLVISADATYPTISNGGGQSGKYISALSIANGVISVTYTTLPALPDYRIYRIEGETPSGTINGSNKTFVTAHKALDKGHVAVYVNGVRQKAGSGNDYTVTIPSSGNNSGKAVIEFEGTAYIPQNGDSLLVDYTTLDIPTV